METGAEDRIESDELKILTGPQKPLTHTSVWCMLVFVKRTNIYLSDDQLKRLEVLRKKSDLVMAEQVRRAVDFWLDSEEHKLILRYREEKKKTK